MVAELVELADAAATTLVGAAATDAWSAVRTGFLRLFRRGGSPDTTDARLQDTAREIEQAAEGDRGQVRAQLAARWSTRLADLLEEHPEAAAELRELLRSVGAEPTVVTNKSYSSHDQSRMFIADGGTINVDLGGDR